MKKQKNRFSKWWINLEEEIHIASTKAPRAWTMFWNLVIFGSILVLAGVIFVEYNQTKLIPFEFEGSCNSGFIGIDYKSKIETQPYSALDRIYDGSNPGDFRLVEHKRYFIEYLPKELNLKNIQGLNCNFKAKGAIPLNKLQELI